jgi:hypothetical protein
VQAIEELGETPVDRTAPSGTLLLRLLLGIEARLGRAR